MRRRAASLPWRYRAVTWRIRGRPPGGGMKKGPPTSLWAGPLEDRLWLLQLDLDVDAGRQVELHQRVHGLVGGVDDVHQALVRADLELVAARLVDVRRTQDVETTHAGRQRHGALDDRAGALGGVHDLGGRLVNQLVVESLEADADLLLGSHGASFLSLITRGSWPRRPNPRCGRLRGLRSADLLPWRWGRSA